MLIKSTVLFKSSNDINIVFMRITRNFLCVSLIYIEMANIIRESQIEL